MFKIGERVTHSIYGLGTVNSLSSININRFGVTFDCGVWKSFSMKDKNIKKVEREEQE